MVIQITSSLSDSLTATPPMQREVDLLVSPSVSRKGIDPEQVLWGLSGHPGTKHTATGPRHTSEVKGVTRNKSRGTYVVEDVFRDIFFLSHPFSIHVYCNFVSPIRADY